MSSKKKIEINLAAVTKSWRGKMIRDGIQNQLGLVHAVDKTSKGVRLRARFPGEKRDRLIAIQSGEGADYVAPDDPKARYLMPTANDLKRINSR